jgi:hypothetical protein
MPILPYGMQETDTTQQEEILLQSENIGTLNDGNITTFIDYKTGSTSCLDLCLASLALLNIGELEKGTDQGSDHFPIECSFGTALTKSNMEVARRWKLDKADWKLWTERLNDPDRNPPPSAFPLDANTYNKHITQKIIDASKEFIPRTSGKKKCKRCTSWWDDNCKTTTENRKTTKNTLWRHPTPANLINMKRSEAIAKNITLKKKRESWKDFASTMHSNTPLGKVHRTIRSINGKQTSYRIPIGDLSATDTERANKLVSHFTRLGTNSVESETSETQHITVNHEISFEAITEDEILNSIKKLKNTSCGEDNISNIFLKRAPPKLISEIKDLYNISLCTGVVPEDWKGGIV